MGGRGGSTSTQYKPQGITILRKNPNKDTKDIYMKEGKYSSERQKVHNRIMNKMIRESSTRTTNPTVHIVTGDSAKSLQGVTNEIKSGYTKIATVNSSRIIQSIPEYKQLIKNGFSRLEATRKVSKEANDILNKTLKELRGKNRSLIISMPISNPQVGKNLIQGFKNKGYNVNLVYSQGTQKIEIKSPNAKIRRDQIYNTYEQLKKQASRYNYYSTNGYVSTRVSRKSLNPKYIGRIAKPTRRTTSNITRSRGRILTASERDRRNVERQLQEARTTAQRNKANKKKKDDFLKYIFKDK